MSWSVSVPTLLRPLGRVLLFVATVSILTTTPVAGQELRRSTNDDRKIGSKLASTIGVVEQAQGGETTHETRLGVHPPLPFKSPLVGPLIKRSFDDDVDHRTTAFVPQPGSLDKLTPVEFPKDEKRWIRVDLSEQTVVAYEGDKPVRAFVVSSGLPRTPTVTGTYRIRTKVREQVMSGENYYLPNVQWVQYFY
ncbi:MAG TPA: L,D-transpeptidase, partial [Caldilineaceae bacterium]|nr:L,D-transpeptidase [Caldilineaceae bacterium]